MAAIKVLVVGDGAYMNYSPPSDGINFLTNSSGSYIQDASDNTFTVSEFIYLITNAEPAITVDTAHRRADPSATYQNFNFATTTDLSSYDVIWLFGYEGDNDGTILSGTGPISDAELAAIATFMDNGGGVFATGDHSGMGSFMCGQIPRVRSMRLWWAQASDRPAGTPATAVNSQGQTIPAVNWPGRSSGTAGRADTLQQNPSDTTTLFQFDDQSDDIPQPLSFPGDVVHPILEGPQGPLGRWPDHMHEGEVVVPADVTATVTFNGTPFTEYPGTTPSHGFQPVPHIIATGAIVGGHGTQVEGSQCEQTNFTTDDTPSVARPLGVLCAYDGHAVGAGRVVTDSSFHHFLDLNLIGDPCGATADRQAGFGPSYTPPAAGSVLADLQAVYVNTVAWLARVDRNFYFTVDKSTFGIDEVANGPAFVSFSDAFWLVIEGFTLTAVTAAVNAGNPQFGGPFAQAGATLTWGTPIGESGASATDVQRVAVPYSVLFTTKSAFPLTQQPPRQLLLTASLSIRANPTQPAQTFLAETVIELIAGEDPFFQNVNPSFGNAFYLSQDVAVFTVTPDVLASPVHGVSFDPASADPPYDYITRLLSALNSDPTFTTPSSPDPFLVSLPSQFLTDGDSSVAYKTDGHRNYNFAVARVRLSGSAGTTAPGVRVFFRLFVTQTSDTDYQPSTSYLSEPDGSGLPLYPLAAPDGETIPFFANPNGASGDYGPGGPNQQNVTVTDNSGQTWAYFGCYLDVFNPAYNLKLFGTHHCIVAQIAFDDSPVVNANGITAGPENSDKLAQRNMEINFSGNPSSAASRLIPQTFDLRPSPIADDINGPQLDRPDELMITWGKIPPGSTASIYWPQVDTAAIVAAAGRLYSTHQLQLADAHTMRVTVTSGATYVPVPSGLAQNVAGLFTIVLPPTVKRGQEFTAIVRRMSSRRGDKAAGTQAEVGAGVGARGGLERNWRYVVGTFLVKIPVAAERSLLAAEEDTYAILSWRYENLAPASRWHPVLERYLSYLADRVNAFGGNASTIKPSPTGVGPVSRPRPVRPWPVRPRPADLDEHTGKVAGVCYDRFGEFEGFLLETESGHERAYLVREAAMEEQIRFAWLDRVVITVFSQENRPDDPVFVILRRAQRPSDR
jgi:hypothetical protein